MSYCKVRRTISLPECNITDLAAPIVFIQQEPPCLKVLGLLFSSNTQRTEIGFLEEIKLGFDHFVFGNSIWRIWNIRRLVNNRLIWPIKHAFQLWRQFTRIQCRLNGFPLFLPQLVNQVGIVLHQFQVFDGKTRSQVRVFV